MPIYAATVFHNSAELYTNREYLIKFKAKCEDVLGGESGTHVVKKFCDPVSFIVGNF